MRVRKKVVDSDDEDKGVSDKKKKRSDANNRRNDNNNTLNTTTERLDHLNIPENPAKQIVETVDGNFDNNNNIIENQNVYFDEANNEFINVVNVILCLDDLIDEIRKLPAQVYNEIYDQLVREVLQQNNSINPIALLEDNFAYPVSNGAIDCHNQSNPTPNYNYNEEHAVGMSNENPLQDVWNTPNFESLGFNPDEINSVNEHSNEHDIAFYNEYVNNAIKDILSAESIEQVPNINSGTQAAINEFNGFHPAINLANFFNENGPINHEIGSVNHTNAPVMYEDRPVTYANGRVNCQNGPISYEAGPVNYENGAVLDPFMQFRPYDEEVPYISERLPDYINEQNILFNSLDPFLPQIPPAFDPTSRTRNMDEDDVPLTQLQSSSIISNDHMLTPFDPAIEFQFDTNEIFNFDLIDYDLDNFYEKSLNMDSFDNEGCVNTPESAEDNKQPDTNDETKPDTNKKIPDENTDPINQSDPLIGANEAPSTSEIPKPGTIPNHNESQEPVETNPANTAPEDNHMIIQCGYCQFHTISLHELRAHMREHTNKDGKKYKCYYCNFLTNKSYYLRQHGAYMHGSAYNCKFCVFKTYSNSKMLSHIRHIH